jgi:hypothetical protein
MPGEARHGDLAAAFLGAQVLFCSTAASCRRGWQSAVQLVGECYVHNRMNERPGNGAGFGNSGYCAGVDILFQELNSATQEDIRRGCWDEVHLLTRLQTSLVG